MLHYTKHFYVTADERDDLSCVADVTLMELILLPAGPSSDGGRSGGRGLMTDFFRFLGEFCRRLWEKARDFFFKNVLMDSVCLCIFSGGEKSSNHPIVR